jgi:hypothetical protein
MSQFLGNRNSLAFFANDTNYVVVDTKFNSIVETGYVDETFDVSDLTKDSAPTSYVGELAISALTVLEPKPLTAAARLYTIPDGVQKEAEKSLEWRKEHKRGGTPVGLNTARTLSKGGQIGIEKVRHIAKYFPRHEVDKKGKGWKPSEDEFPSAGRIAWALWGGDAGWRWAKAIVEREEKKSLTADGYYQSVGADVSPFVYADTMDDLVAPDFLARVRMDGSGIDRIYKVDLDGLVYVWDDGSWDDLGSMDGDIWTYDKALDDPYDTVEKTHVLIDPDSAMAICARKQNEPFASIRIEELDEEEAGLFEDFTGDDEFEFIDDVITAALPPQIQPQGADGYTSEERSQNVKKQPRDSRGLFVQVGKRVVVGGDTQNGRGEIKSVNKDGTVTVALENGNEINVQSNMVETQTGEKSQPSAAPGGVPMTDEPIDLSGILGEPRTPQNMPKAHLPGTLPPISSADLHSMLNDWDGWVQSQRAQFKPEPRTSGAHPLIERLGNRGGGTKSKSNSTSETWAKPVTAAADVKAKPSDVQPLYLAIVSPEDPRAVMDLVAVVPASATSNAPMTYIRQEKKWVRQPEILSDLKSATPPPVVPLEPGVLNEVLTQVDSLVASVTPNLDTALMVLWGPRVELIQNYKNLIPNEVLPDLESLLAAGGLDKNRGQAESLRRYWTKGKGALKIRWGTPGDWKRCVRYLSKYLGVRSKGYCQLRHKEATGVYTGSRMNPGNENAMEEPMYGFPGVDTIEITEKDLLTPLDEIMKESDDLYEATWEPEEEIVNALKELNQFEGEEYEALVAAGNWLTNRRKAKKLRRYWTIGRGGKKIRWNSGGDWYRCVRYLTKYLGPRAKGYCALRHKEMTGMWTGDQEHLKMYGGGRGRNMFSTHKVKSSEQIISDVFLSAQAESAKERVLVAGGYPVDGLGPQFYIPLVIPEDMESGDGRKFTKGAISWRELPLPLMWQMKTSEGHNGSVVVGRIDHMERVDNGVGNCYGVFDTGASAREVVRLIQNGFIRGVSADMDRFEAKEVKNKNESTVGELAEEKSIGKDKILINQARVMGVTIVPKPAFQECSIQLGEDISEQNPQEEPVIKDGIYVDDVDVSDAQSLVACGFVAGAIPVSPPKEWFANPKLDKSTPLTVTDEGRVYGHIAAWNVDHIGLSFGTKPPRSKSNYSYFHTGVVRTEQGDDIPVGQLTLAGGHASLEASAAEAVKHYDDTASAIADVHAGEDSYGIWVSGALRPGVQPEQIRALRASAPSGDWRPIRGSLELVAVCQVNVPGFPIARARVASGAVMALVAAGAQTLARLKSDPITELTERLSRLEKTSNSELSNKAFAAREVFAAIREQKNAELSARAEGLSQRFETQFSYLDDFAYISRRERKSLAEVGMAMPDGSFPIRNIEDLKNAVQSYGRANESARASVQRFIEKRARSLKRPDLIPSEWKEASNAEFTQKIDSMRSKIASFAFETPVAPAGGEVVEPGKSSAVEPAVEDVNAPTVESGLKVDGVYTPKTQPRDAKGKFRQVLARLKSDIGTSGLQNIVEDARKVGEYYEIGDYVNSAGAAVKLLDIVDRLDAGALNSKSIENVRSSARELGSVIANLPLGFNDQAQKVRYSDLPPSLQNLMDDMMTRVESKIGKKDADIATADLKAFKSGADVYSQGEISGQMSKMLRLLT